MCPVALRKAVPEPEGVGARCPAPSLWGPGGWGETCPRAEGGPGAPALRRGEPLPSYLRPGGAGSSRPVPSRPREPLARAGPGAAPGEPGAGWGSALPRRCPRPGRGPGAQGPRPPVPPRGAPCSALRSGRVRQAELRPGPATGTSAAACSRPGQGSRAPAPGLGCSLPGPASHCAHRPGQLPGPGAARCHERQRGPGTAWGLAPTPSISGQGSSASETWPSPPPGPAVHGRLSQNRGKRGLRRPRI